MGGGGFGGVESLEKKRQYKVGDEYDDRRKDRYGMVYDEEELRRKHERDRKHGLDKREKSRSRSPRRESTDYDKSDRGRVNDRRYDDWQRVRHRDKDSERYGGGRNRRDGRDDDRYQRR
jgi:peptidyl-prolyl cis-trans isomerase-like 4